MAAKKTRSKTKKKTTRAKAKPTRAKKKPARRTRPAASEPAGVGDPRVGQIQRLIDVMVASGAVEVEWEGQEGERLRIRLKEDSPALVSYAPPPPVVPSAPPPASTPVAPIAAGAPVAPEPAPARGQVFHSPMVGTFYSSPSPDAEAFVDVGDHVEPDTTLCILEAMKVMNEIKAEISGAIVEVLAQNGQPVEFGQPLFVIDPD